MIDHKTFSSVPISIMERNIRESNMFIDPSIKIQNNQWLDLSDFQFVGSGNKVFLGMLKFNKLTLRFAKS